MSFVPNRNFQRPTGGGGSNLVGALLGLIAAPSATRAEIARHEAMKKIDVQADLELHSNRAAINQASLTMDEKRAETRTKRQFGDMTEEEIREKGIYGIARDREFDIAQHDWQTGAVGFQRTGQAKGVAARIHEDGERKEADTTEPPNPLDGAEIPQRVEGSNIPASVHKELFISQDDDDDDNYKAVQSAYERGQKNRKKGISLEEAMSSSKKFAEGVYEKTRALNPTLSEEDFGKKFVAHVQDQNKRFIGNERFESMSPNPKDKPILPTPSPTPEPTPKPTPEPGQDTKQRGTGTRPRRRTK